MPGPLKPEPPAVAYIVLTHGEPFQAIDLLWSIWREEDIYFVHLDRRSPAWSRAALEAVAASRPNIRMVPAESCGWGGFSLVAATRRCLTAALSAHHGWTHAVLVSGTHVPLRRAADLAAALDPGHSYLAFHRLDLAVAKLDPPNWFSGIANRIVHEYREVPGLGLMRGPPREGPEGVGFFWGSQWWALNRRSAAYIDESRHTALHGFLSHAALPDEIYFQTMLANSPLAENLRQTQLVWQQWGPHGHPIPLSSDALRVAGTSKCFFARKATRSLLLDPDDGLSPAIPVVDRGAWTAFVVEAFSRFLSRPIVEPVTRAYLQPEAKQDAVPDAGGFALRAMAEEIAVITAAAARRRALRARVATTVNAGLEARVTCTFPEARCAARYFLLARLSTPDLAWVAIHIGADDLANAAADLRDFPTPDQIDGSFPPVKGFAPFHDILAYDLRLRGVVPLTDPRHDAVLRDVLDAYFAVLAGIPGMPLDVPSLA